MATATFSEKSRSLLTRLLATVAIVCVYVFGSLATAGVMMTSGATNAEARGRRGRRGRGGRRGRRGRGSRRGRRGRRGRGIYYGGSYCSLQRIRCADVYGWGSGGYYRCVWRRGC